MHAVISISVTSAFTCTRKKSTVCNVGWKWKTACQQQDGKWKSECMNCGWFKKGTG